MSGNDAAAQRVGGEGSGEPRTVRILSIDGGGIRGLIPALILQELETRIKRRAGAARPLHACFDMIAGTSTGGIIAAGLVARGRDGAAACDAGDLVDLYEQDGGAIFPHTLFQKARAVFERKYDAAPLEKFLDERLGDATTADALTNVVIPAYDIEARAAVIMAGGPRYREAEAWLNKAEPAFLLREAARGTSAAPTYFAPAYVEQHDPDAEPGREPRMLALVDGGVFANNPSMVALVEAQKLRWDVTSIELLSIGTGGLTQAYFYHDAQHWGAKDWIDPAKGSPILSILMQAGSSTAAYQVKQWLRYENGRRPPHYTRIAGELTDVNDELDDATPLNLKRLRLLATRWIQANDDALDDWAECLATGAASAPA